MPAEITGLGEATVCDFALDEPGSKKQRITKVVLAALTRIRFVQFGRILNSLSVMLGPDHGKRPERIPIFRIKLKRQTEFDPAPSRVTTVA